MDAMGFSSSIEANFDIHQLGHARAIAYTHGETAVMGNFETIKAKPQ
jgi:hypothetical protein